MSYHAKFDKQAGEWRLLSYGGGSPRWATIRFDRREIEIPTVSMDDLKDLQYLIGRMLEEALTD